MDCISIVIADDNPEFVRTITRFLQQENGLRIVGAASNGEELLALAAETMPDVILLDLQMPEMGGLEALPVLRAGHPGSVIIIMTLLDVEVYRQYALERGADHFVAKTEVAAELLPLIHQCQQIELRSSPC